MFSILRVNYRIKASDHCIELYSKWFSTCVLNRQHLEFCWSIAPNVSLSDIRIDGWKLRGHVFMSHSPLSGFDRLWVACSCCSTVLYGSPWFLSGLSGGFLLHCLFLLLSSFHVIHYRYQFVSFYCYWFGMVFRLISRFVLQMVIYLIF